MGTAAGRWTGRRSLADGFGGGQGGSRLFTLILILGGTLMHFYVVWRAGTVPLVRRRLSPAGVLAVGSALWIAFAGSLLLVHGSTGWSSGILEAAGMTWLAVVFLAGAMLLLVDVPTLFGLVLRRPAAVLRGWALAAAAALSVVACVQGVRAPVVREYEVSLAGLPARLDGTVVVALADLHLGRARDEGWRAARVEQVQSLHPDAVVILGDVFEGHGAPAAPLLRALRRISAPLGVWAVTGNHACHRRGGGSEGLLERAGFRVLHDRWAGIAPGLVLAGVDDLTSRRRAGEHGDPVGEALAGHPHGAMILLSHTPWQAERAAALGVALMLSGHTHGGQLWPFGLLERGLYPLMAGRYAVGGMTVIVSRGTGTWGPRMRLWQPAEIVRVRLHPQAPSPL